ncbi:hypothetical protein Taro_031722 [Colocasia esculenta]|uniref:Retrotransposon gag domain-containing protein n=1 Tax=Colocasia esculenta TaxID=4460 RepID=A0A843VJJ1_COLES|nr:hypothetical protein [Colocasia esculenta]
MVPFLSVYVTLGPFRVPGSVGGGREYRVLGVGRGRSQARQLVEQQDESEMPAQGQVQEEVSADESDMAPCRRSQSRQLVEQQDESEMPAQGQVQEEVSADESVAQPQGVAAAAVAGGQQQQEYQPQPQQYADWFPMAEQFFRAMYQGAWHPGRRRTAVTEDRTTLLERFLRLRPPMFHGEYDPDKAESWTHELERIFKTMECAEEDQRFSEVFHGEYFPDYAQRERRDQFHTLVQDDLTVSQYHQRFVWLLRHVPHVAGSDQACAERFIAGLRPDLRWGVMAHMCTTLGEAMAKATALDRETWQPQQQQQQQQRGASSRSSPYQRPAGSRGSATSSSSGSGSSDGAGIRSQFRKLSTRGGGRSRQQKRQSRFAEQSVVQGAEQGETSQQRQGARQAEETGR